MNFLRQGFEKLSSETDRQTDRQTDALEIIYHATLSHTQKDVYIQ